MSLPPPSTWRLAPALRRAPTHESSDGDPSYALEVELDNDVRYESASSWSLEEVEEIRGRVEAFLAA